jgi:hypothetical protein
VSKAGRLNTCLSELLFNDKKVCGALTIEIQSNAQTENDAILEAVGVSSFLLPRLPSIENQETFNEACQRFKEIGASVTLNQLDGIDLKVRFATNENLVGTVSCSDVQECFDLGEATYRSTSFKADKGFNVRLSVPIYY